jgi:hypothetical protein
MADASIFTLGVPTLLLERQLLGSRPWNQQKKKLVCRGERVTLTLTFKKLSARSLEPWQRAGFWLEVQAAVTAPSIAKILGLRPTAALLTGHVCPPAGTNPLVSHAWNTHDDDPEALVDAVGRRLGPILDAVVDALDAEGGLEAVSWHRLLDRLDDAPSTVAWPTPEEGIESAALRLYGAGDNDAEHCAHYAATLLLRREHANVARWIEALGSELTEGPLWDAVRAEQARQAAAGDEPRPLPPCDWGLATLEREIAEREAAALVEAADEAAPAEPEAVETPIATPPTPPATPPTAGTVWELLASAIRPTTYRDEDIDVGVGVDGPATFEWKALLAGLEALTPEQREAFAEHEATLAATLATMPHGYRRTPEEWVQAAARGEPPIGWTLARSLGLEADVTLAPELTVELTHLHMYDADEIGRVEALELPKLTEAEFAWSTVDLARCEQLAAALPALCRLRAEIPDAELATIAKAEVVTRLESLVSTHSGSFDKGVKALAKRKDLQLRELSIDSDIKAPAVKALLKAAWAPQLTSLQVGRSSPAGCATLVAGLAGPLQNLRKLVIRTGVELGDAALPLGIEDLHLEPGYDGLASCVTRNPDLPLRRLVIGGYGVELPIADALVGWPASGALEELSLAVHSNDDSPYDQFFGRLARCEWPALRSIALQLYEPDDAALKALADWIARCPALASLRVQSYQPTATLTGARALAAATQNLRLLELQLPPMIGALASQSWPALIGLRLDLQPISSELTVPIRGEALGALAEKMPALRYASITNGALADDAEAAAQGLRELPSLLLLELPS